MDVESGVIDIELAWLRACQGYSDIFSQQVDRNVFMEFGVNEEDGLNGCN